MNEGVMASLFATLQGKACDVAMLLVPAKAYVLEHFGPNGLIAAYIALGAIGVLLVFQVVKLAFSAVKFIVLPSLALALIGSLLSPLPFGVLLPAAVAACSVVFLFKG